MKAVIAIDSLKGSLSSMEAGNAVKEGIMAACPKAEVVVKPLADGGEGTTEAFVEGFGGEWVHTAVMGPLGTSVEAAYGVLPQKKTAVLEMAAASGIMLVKREERDVIKATTYGVGEMILDAIKRGCRHFIIGIGGSATNDCGVGMLTALGYRFLDETGAEVPLGAGGLGRIVTIDGSGADPALSECSFQVACDVNNPLCGELGATYVFGPQKGVTEELKPELDQMLQKFSQISAAFTGNDYSKTAGAGAAGGLGYAFLSYLNTDLQPGISLVLDAIKLETELRDADIVITGEGQLDRQTAMGKVPAGVAKLAKKYKLPVIAFAGSLSKEAYLCNEAGIDAFFSILPRIQTLDEAMDKENARNNMKETAEQVFRLLSTVGYNRL